ncbi:MAG: class I SAM-dependent methyltransferase [Oscillospiraceae bacterium]|nr:class I SAM-dependent methyltransferase [Oscillospiraceae bacterium]
MVKSEEKFTGIANLYKNFRPSYPKELIDYLYSQVGFLDSSIIADVGSGTGMFSHLLIERGSSVYCVEPNDDMRKTAESDLVGAGLKNFYSINASAENLKLQEKSIDFVTVAQAFHWFDRILFKSECRRVLRNNGAAVLAWNFWDYSAKIIKEQYIIREKYCVGTQGLMTRDMQKSDVRNFFLDEIYEKRRVKNDLFLNRESFIGLYLTGSHSPREKKNPEKYYGLIKELNMHFDQHNIGGTIHLPQFTECYIGMV